MKCNLIAATNLVILHKIGFKSLIFLAHVTRKFDGRTRKTIGHLFYTKSCCVHNFKAISEFKLELQSVNAKFESKLVIFFPVTSKFDRSPSKTIGHLIYATWNFVYHFIAICQFKIELPSGNAKFVSKSVIFLSRVTLKFYGWPSKNNRAPLLCYFKLCASFHSHLSIQNGVTIRKRQIWVKIDDFFVPCDLQIWWMTLNKANLRDLIAATGLVI